MLRPAVTAIAGRGAPWLAGRPVASALGLALLLALGPATTSARSFAEPVWRVSTQKLPGLAWKPRRSGAPVLDRRGGQVLVGAADGLWALDALTGDKLWRVPTADPIAGPPLLDAAGSTITFADGGGVVQTLGLGDGKPRWARSSLLDAVVRAPLVGDGARLYALVEPGSLFALDALTGKALWRRAVPGGRDFLAEGTGAATVHGESVIAGLGDGNLVVVNGRDGGVVWTRDLAGGGDGPPDVDTTPLVVQSGAGEAFVLAASQRGGLYALSLGDGEVRWHRKGEGYQTPLRRGDELWVVDGDHRLLALRASDGKLRVGRHLDGEPSGALALWRTFVLVMAGDGLWLLSGDDQQTRGRVVDPYGYAAAPCLDGDDAWMIGNDGTIWALRLREP